VVEAVVDGRLRHVYQSVVDGLGRAR
jgi:hypothetical protein